MTVKRVMSTVVCTVLLAACDDAPQEQGPAAPAAAQPTSKLGVIPADMVAAVSAGKAATAVGVHFALRGVPTFGKPLPIDIAIMPHVPFESMRVTFESRDGVTLSEGAVLGPLGNTPPEKAIKHQVVVRPVGEGVFMVTAIVDTEGAEGSITRVFSIPVIVNAAPGVPAPTPAPAMQNPGEPAAVAAPAS